MGCLLVGLSPIDYLGLRNSAQPSTTIERGVKDQASHGGPLLKLSIVAYLAITGAEF